MEFYDTLQMEQEDPDTMTEFLIKSNLKKLKK